jgi:CBS domain-containing protein
MVQADFATRLESVVIAPDATIAQAIRQLEDAGTRALLVTDEERRLRALPHVADLQALRLPRGRGVVHGWVLPVATRIPAVRRRLLSVLVARFA